MIKEIKISFPGYAKDIYALPGTSLFECIARADILIRTPCGGAGTCGKCAVKVIAGNLTATEDCKRHFSEQEIAEGYRLACRCAVGSDLAIEIPERSLFETETVTLGAEQSTQGTVGHEVPLSDSCIPLIKKRHLQLTEPTLETPVSDLDSIQTQVGDLSVSLVELQKLPQLIRDNNFSDNLR